jgi:hypothetical protein
VLPLSEGDQAMRHVYRSRWPFILAAGFVGPALLAIAALFTGAFTVRQRHEPVGTRLQVMAADPLAASVSPTPRVQPYVPFAQLRPAQQTCLQAAGLKGQYEAARNTPLAQGLLNGLAACIDHGEGHPPPPSLPYPQLLATPSTPIAPAEPIPSRPAGAGTIVEAGDHSSKIAIVENVWIEGSGSSQITVVAGALRAERDNGRLDLSQGFVEVRARTGTTHPSGRFLTPLAVGPVRIVDAVGEVLTLQASNGTQFYFDVASGRYLTGPAAGASPAAQP